MGLGTPWSVLVPPIDPNWTHVVNRSIDVTLKNCFNNFDTLACIRSSVLCFLSLATGLICCSRLVNLHMWRESAASQHHIAFFYVATVHCLVGSIEWFIGWTTHASLACVYLRSLELLIVCHFYMTLAARVTHCANDIAGRSTALLLSVVFVYFTCFIVIGLVFAQDPIIDCFAYYWLFLSGGHFVIIQVLLFVCVLLCSKINSVSASEVMKRAQRLELFMIVFSFELSSILSLSYHMSMSLLATADGGGCSGVFNHCQSFYSSVRLPLEILVYLCPLWTILYVLRPDSLHARQMHDTNNQIIHSGMVDSSSGVLLDAGSLSDHTLLIPSRTLTSRRFPGLPRGIYIRSSRTTPTMTFPQRRLCRTIRRSMRSTMSVPTSRAGLVTIPEEHSGESRGASLE